MKSDYTMRGEDEGTFSLQNAYITYAAILEVHAFLFLILSRTVPRVLLQQKALWRQSFPMQAEVKQL